VAYDRGNRSGPLQRTPRKLATALEHHARSLTQAESGAAYSLRSARSGMTEKRLEAADRSTRGSIAGLQDAQDLVGCGDALLEQVGCIVGHRNIAPAFAGGLGEPVETQLG